MTPNFGLIHWIRRPSTWMCVLALVLSLIALPNPDLQYYVESIATNSTLVFFLLTPAVAAAAAWEASRFRHLTTIGSAATAHIYLNRLAPWSLIMPLGYTLAFFSHNISSTYISEPLPWILLAYSFLVGICWTLIGAALGFVTKPLISVGLVGALGYTYYAVLPSTPPGILRRMAGDFIACCSPSTRLDPKEILAAITGVIGFTLLVISIATLIQALKTKSFSLLPLVSFIASLVFIVSSASIGMRLSEFGIISRDEQEMRCTHNVCAWPEIPEKYIHLNAEAQKAFKKIAPPEWKHYAENPVMWTGDAKENLMMSGRESVDEVLGHFVDQAGAYQLIQSRTPICGLPLESLEHMSTYLPWDPQQPVTAAAIAHRLEESRCGSKS